MGEKHKLQKRTPHLHHPLSSKFCLVCYSQYFVLYDMMIDILAEIFLKSQRKDMILEVSM